MKTRTYIGLFAMMIALLSLSACKHSGNEAENKNMNNKMTEEVMQDKSDLLAGTYKAIAYSGFRSGQHPDRGDGAKNPSFEEIVEDLQILAKDGNFPLIRLYDCGENSQMVLQAIKEHNVDIKVLLGVWLRAEISNHEGCPWLTEPIPQKELDANKQKNLAEVEMGIALANKYPEIIAAVNVGNEALVEWNDHMVPVETVIEYVQKVKSGIKQQVMVAENYEWWAKDGKTLAEVVDFLGIHIYPVWEGKDIDEGLSYSIENMQRVADSLPGKSMVITEAGWATIASEFGERASEEKQLRYYHEIMNWSKENNITTFFFEAFDEDWKGNPDNPLGAEKHWGIFTVDRKPKLVMKDLYPELLK